MADATDSADRGLTRPEPRSHRSWTLGGVRTTAGRGRDLRLLPVAVSAWAGAFLGTGGLVSVRVAVGLTVLSIALVGVAGRPKPDPALAVHGLRRADLGLELDDVAIRWVVLACLVVAAAAGSAGALRESAVSDARNALDAHVGSSTTVTMTATTDPVPTSASVDGSPRVRWVARLEQVGPSRVRVPALVLAPDAWRHTLAGQRVSVDATLERLAETRGAPLAMAVTIDADDAVTSASAGIYGWAEPFRAGLRDAAEALSEDPRGLLPALVLGDESRVPESLRAAMASSGLAHLTAVSGANVAIVTGLVLLMARRAGATGRALVVVAVIAIGVFVVLARPQPSVLRASAMGLAAATALVTGRTERGPANLATAVGLLVLLDPWLSRSIGFGLSALATAGILFAGPPFVAALQRWLPPVVAMAVAVALAAQVAVAPMLVAVSGEVSLVGIPANILAAPLVPPATVLGFASAVVAPPLPWLAAVLAWLGGVPTSAIAGIAHRGADVPGAVVAWGWGWPAATAAACLAYAGLWLCLRSRLLTLGLATALLVLLLRPVPGTTWPPPGWQVVACDVGQGDALVLRSAPTAAVVVDAGPDPDLVDRCLDLLAVTEVPLLVVTHMHADHVDGVAGVDRGRSVGQVLTTPLRDPERGAQVLEAWAQERGTDIRFARPGDQVQISPALHLRVLGPAGPVSGGSAANQASVVLMASLHPTASDRADPPGAAGSGPLTVLLTGDVEAEAQEELLSRESDLSADVLKVPHHGSADQSLDLFAATGARVALVSTGTGNTYGHPAPSTLDALRRLRARVLRTDALGHVALQQDPTRGEIHASWSGTGVGADGRG